MDAKKVTKLLLVSAILGGLVGVVSRLFLYLITKGTELVWQDILPWFGDSKWWLLVITISGGLLMGLCVKYFDTNPGLGFEAVMGAAKKDGDLRNIQFFRVVVSSAIGLISGASIGPEASLITLGGLVGSRLAKLLRMTKEALMAQLYIAFGAALGVLLSTPIVGPILVAEAPPTDDKSKNAVFIFASMVAASVGFAVYYSLNGELISDLRIVPQYQEFHSIELLWAVLIGVVGTVVGFLTKKSIEQAKTRLSKFDKFPVGRGILVGLLIGLIGVWMPLTLFNGSHQFSQLVSHSVPYGLLTLFGLFIARIVGMSLAFGGGYQGGNIFPTFFIAGVVGLMINIIFPSIPYQVAVMACIASAMFVFTPMPLLVLFLLTELSGFTMIPVMAMAICSTYVIKLALETKIPKLNQA